MNGYDELQVVGVFSEVVVIIPVTSPKTLTALNINSRFFPIDIPTRTLGIVVDVIQGLGDCIVYLVELTSREFEGRLFYIGASKIMSSRDTLKSLKNSNPFRYLDLA